MSNTKKGFAQLEEISDATKQALSVSSLSNTPNKTQYGTPALSAQELKARFDALADKLIDRWNMLVRILNDGKDEDGIPVPLASIIPLSGEGIPSEITNVKQLAEAIQDGTLYAMIEDNNEITLATIISNIEVAINSHKSRLDNLDNANEWDYVIDKAEDFTTENLATMSGNVLVKGVRIEDYIEKTDNYNRKLIVTVPKSIKVLKFLDCSLFVNLMSSTCEYTSDNYGDIYNLNVTAPQDTKIIGLTGVDIGGGAVWADVYGFSGVEFTNGWVSLHYCDNIRHCTIMRADHCNNLFDIILDAYNWDAEYVEFDHCTMINGVNATESWYYEVEFVSCKHITNVHKIPALDGYEVIITYTNCSYVDGDTCDDYYTEEDEDKVQVIKLDGTKYTIAVYSQNEINSKLGDLSTILTALHEGGIE